MDEYNYLENLPNYHPQKGEKYMNSNQLEHFKNKLIMWKSILEKEVAETIDHMRNDSTHTPDELDRATMEEEFRLEIRTREREHKLMQKIEESLLRIDRSEYGYCRETGEEIGLARLDARPTADLCIAVKEKMEQREKQGLHTK